MASVERDRWSRSEEVFHDALQHRVEDRAGFVYEVCGEDAELCREVLSLLECHQKAGSWVIPPGSTLLEEAEAVSLHGQRLGSYRIEREIGQGGMGAVFLASRADDQYQKNVAIKLVRTGLLTAFLADRFRNERQILAALEHPYIARLLDGGVTADGQPFLVMEYVEGVPVDAYCDAHDLSMNERLQLFRKLCAAVHYAHQRLVIHRDLKPSNILVTAQGEPKLLDFGIAKLVDPETASSATTEFLLATPLYASPELVNGQAVTTVTDVYSLGVILYRLLTGRSPYGNTTSGLGLFHAILNGDIPKPSSVALQAKRRVPGDLDSIVLKALRREPERRYASAEQLSEDVRRHLESLPVLAGSESFRYIAAKFMRRNRIAVAAGTIVAVSLIAATAVSLHQSNIAARERRLAEQRLESLRSLTGSVLFEFHDAIQALPGATQARKLLTQRALEYLNSLDPSTARDPAQRAQIVEAYRKIGDVQGNPTNANLGDTAGALASYAKALEMAQEMVKSSPGDNGSRRILAVLLQRIADTRALAGEVQRAVDYSRQALAIFSELAERDNSLEAQQQAGIAHIKLGDLLGHPVFPNIGDRNGAFDHYQQALSIYSNLKPPDNSVTRRYLGVIHERIGKMLELQGRKSEALASYQKSFAIREALSSDNPVNTNARRDLAIAHEKIGDLLVATGQTSKGIGELQEARKILDSIHTLDPFNANAARAVGIEYEKIAGAFALAGDAARAKLYSAKALSLFQRLAASDPMNALARGDLKRVSNRQ
jgi:non-specific serine/threonine protein kinase/serine/threonine-protein kinase